MRKTAIIALFMVLLLSLPSIGFANTESQTLVSEGRAQLFNNGNPTYSGIETANATFEQAVAADPTDQAANLFYAVTRVAVFGLEKGNGTAFETLRDLYEAFGITRNSNDSVGESPVNDPPELQGQYNPPDTVPGGESMRAFLVGPFTDLLNAALSNLSVVDSSFTMTITAAETGDMAMEVDYGDVLVLKSTLYALKSLSSLVGAYDEDMNLRDLLVKGNMGVFQLQDILDAYPNLLSLRSADGSTLLTSARQAFLAGIDTYREAYQSVTGRTGSQADHLFFFGSQQEQNEADHALTILTEMENSLNANRATDLEDTIDTWVMTNQVGDTVQMVIRKDPNDVFIQGSVSALNGGSFPFSEVSDFSISGTEATITMKGWDSCGPISATFTGTLSASGDQITAGSYQWTDCDGNSVSGTFTGTLQSSTTQAERNVDLNRVFGNTGKSPLDIRAVLPQFDQDDDILSGTFPGNPILNGIFTDNTPQEDFANFLSSRLVYDVPTAQITVDGNSDDWAGIATMLNNESNPNAPANGNIKSISVAKDSNYLYWMMTLYDPPANDVYYDTYFDILEGLQPGTNYDSGIYGSQYSLYSFYQGQGTLISTNPADAAIGNVIEARVPLSAFSGAVKTSLYASTSDAAGKWDYSDGDAYLRFPSGTVSGSIASSAYNGTGDIFVWAYDGPDPNTAHALGKTVIDGTGNYTIEGLPIGQTVYLYALWDADNNGIITDADYTSGATALGPYTVQSGGTATGSTSVDSPIEDLVVNFGSNGLWDYSGSAWNQLTTLNADLMASWQGGIAAHFASSGLWSYNGSSWDFLTTNNPEQMVGWSQGLTVDFGANGLWNYNGTNWSPLTTWDPQNMEAWSGGLAVDFGASGLWTYDGSTWTLLTTHDAEAMKAWSHGLAVDFGSFGLWNYDGSSWTLLTTYDASMMQAWNGGLAVDFSNGLWSYDGSSWTFLTTSHPEGMKAWKNGLAADFGANGLWSYDGSSLTLLTTQNAQTMVGWGSGLAVDLGAAGLWIYDGANWSQLTTWDADDMITANVQ